MKILKGIFYAIFAIVVLIFVIALFLPPQYKVERSTEINGSIDTVYGFVADFNNFHDWNPWTPLEPKHNYEVLGDSGSLSGNLKKPRTVRKSYGA